MRKCPSCGDEVIGRVDKVFCSPYCKSNFHYFNNQDKELTMFKKIDNQLKTNRRLLKEFNKAGKATVRKNIMHDRGFDPKFFTHYWKNDKGQVYLFCYEFGFLSANEHGKEKYVLVHWQKYMGSI